MSGFFGCKRGIRRTDDISASAKKGQMFPTGTIKAKFQNEKKKGPGQSSQTREKREKRLGACGEGETVMVTTGEQEIKSKPLGDHGEFEKK